MSELYELFSQHPRISTDTRRIEPDSIFFALRGDTFDGNRFVAEALEKGAAYAVSDDPQVAASDERQRIVLVDDTLKALQDLARCHRRALGIPILTISGSNGKTTTKELVSRVLAERFEVYATRGNLNNHIGVPLTLLAMTRDTEFGVVEMGASACGELALLASVAEPNYGIMEKADNVYVRCGEFGWSDVGTWGSVYQHSRKDRYANAVPEEGCYLYDTRSSIVSLPKDKIAVISGLKEYIVVDTDDVLMVCPRSEEQNIKKFIDEVKFHNGDKHI